MNDDLDQRLADTLAAHRDATEARRAGGVVSASAPHTPDGPTAHRRWDPPGHRRWRAVALAAAVVAALLAGVAVLDRGGRMEQLEASATSLPPGAASEPTTGTGTGTGTGTDDTTQDSPTTSAVSPGPDRSTALWFRNHFEGLADDTGTIYRHRTAVDYVGPMVRVANGDIYLLQDEQLFELPSGSTEPRPVQVEGPVMTVELGEGGEAIWLDPDGRFHSLDGREARLGPVSSRTAANGWTASVTDPVVTRQPETDLIDMVEAPAELVVTDRDGRTVWRHPVGGASAATAGLEDFDGRRAIVSRAPEEPAGSPSQMLLIDLACDPVCVRTSIGLGDTVLNGPDVTGDPPLAPDGAGAGGSAGFRLGLCPTEGIEALEPPAALSARARSAYRQLALGLATCDPFTFHGAAADASVQWSSLLGVLLSPPLETSTDGQVAWNFTDPASERWLSIDATGLWTIDRPTG